jgi:hypothetical protein
VRMRWPPRLAWRCRLRTDSTMDVLYYYSPGCRRGLGEKTILLFFG